MARTLDELLSDEPAWPGLLESFAASPHDVRIVEADAAACTAALLAVQVTTRSRLGALAWNCGAVLIDRGWVRIVGAGAPGLAGVHPERLDDPQNARPFDGVIVAYDVLGGRFAIHGGGLDEIPLGEVVYWAPDTLAWEGTGRGHGELVEFLVSDRLDDFYSDLRWPGWEAEAAPLAPGEGITVFPYLWSTQGWEGSGPDAKPGAVSRAAVPMREIIAIAEDTARQFRELSVADGSDVNVRFDR